MRKILSLGVAILVAFFSTNCIGANNDFIVGGDGSFDNPYILKDENNKIADYINKNYEEKKQQKYSRSTQIFPASTKVDTSKTIANPGSYWRRTSGGGSTSTNGSMVFTLIDYTNWNQMGDMCANALKGNVQSTLRDIAASSYSATTAKSLLTKLGITNSVVISGFLPAIGYAAAVYGGITSISSFTSAVNNRALADAQLNRHNLMSVHYRTSYNGAWYSHSRVEEGTRLSNPQIPQSMYGVGKYTNSTRIK